MNLKQTLLRAWIGIENLCFIIYFAYRYNLIRGRERQLLVQG